MAARSILWPPVLEGGRLEMTPDLDDPATLDGDLDLELSQIIALSLLSYRCANPFNTGLGMADPTWSAQDSATETAIRARVTARFKVLEGTRRARLDAITFARSPATGVLTCSIAYHSLETSRAGRVERPVV